MHETVGAELLNRESNDLPPLVKRILEEYITITRQQCPDLIEGLYLYGSVGLGAFLEKHSDLDFIAVTTRRLNVEEMQIFSSIHRKIVRRWKKPEMNGIYVTWNDLGKLPQEIDPFPHYYGGKFYRSGYFELNLVTWFELKHYGVTVYGPDANTLPFDVNWNELIRLMYENLQTYWAGWIQRPKENWLHRLKLLFSSEMVEWGVLGITRLYYTFRENDIASKAGAGHYALKVVPERWHTIIREAINIRQGDKKSLFESRKKRYADTLAYMDYIMRECATIYDDRREKI